MNITKPRKEICIHIKENHHNQITIGDSKDSNYAPKELQQLPGDQSFAIKSLKHA